MDKKIKDYIPYSFTGGKLFKGELLDLLKKYGIIKEIGSVELFVKTNGFGILKCTINNIENI